MKTQFLSYVERDFASKQFYIFTFFNGLGFGFLADTTVYLLAIYFGASNIQLGYISSLIHLSGIVLILTPKLISGKNIVKVYFWAWLFRGVVCLINGLTLIASKQIAVAVILISYTLFCGVRIVAVTLYNPMIQMVSTPATLGSIITNNNLRFNLGNILGKVVSYLIVSIVFLKGLLGLLALQLTGVIFNTIATIFLKKIPCREKIDSSPGQNIFAMLFKNIGKKDKIVPLLVYWIFLSLTVMSGFSIPLLKKTIGFEQNTVFLFTIFTAVSLTLSMYVVKPFIDKLAVKPFVIFLSFLDIGVYIVWALIVPLTSIYVIFAFGMASSFLRGVNQSMISRSLISSIPHKEKVSYNSMITFFSGIFAFVFGMIAGVIGDFGEKNHPPFFNPYFVIFITAAVLSLINVVLAFFIRSKEHTGIREIAELFLSFKNIKTMFDIQSFETTSDPQKRQIILMSLKYSAAPFAINEIRKILNNPLSSETEEVLKSLFAKPRPKLLPEILKIAKDSQSYHQATAIFALGSYPDNEVEKTLIKLLDDHSSRIQSSAAKSLARIGNTAHLDKIITLSKDTDLPVWDLMNYIIGILTIDQKGMFLKEIFNIADKKKDKSYRQTVYSLISRLLHFTPELNIIYQKENIEELSGIRMLLDEARHIEPFYKNMKLIKDNFNNKDLIAVWDWIRALLGKYSHKEPYLYINQAIKMHKNKNIDITDTIAALYFSFIILSEEYGN